MALNRRNLLLATGGAVALAGCGLTLTQLQTDASLLQAGLETVNTFVVALNPPWIASYNQVYAEVIGLVSVISSSSTTPPAAVISKGVQALTSLYNLVKPNAQLPPAVLDALEAAESLAPVFLAAVGLTGAPNHQYKYNVEVARSKLRSIKYSNPVNYLINAG